MPSGPDYKKYSLPELLEAKKSIDAEQYPQRASELDKEIVFRNTYPEYYEGRSHTDPPPQLDRVSDGPLAGRDYALFSTRLGADLLDGLIVLTFAVAAYQVDRYVLGLDSFFAIRDSAQDFGLADTTLYALFLYNMTYLVGKHGKSWGRMIVGIEVLSIEGKPIGFLRALGRNLFAGFISGIFYLGFFWMLVDKKKQTWHDKVFRTYVVSSSKV